jgi:competence protein ComEC
VKSADRLPGSHWWVVGPSDWWLLVFYLAIAVIIFLPRYLPSMRWRVALAGAWCGLGLIAALPAQPTGDTLKCTFIAVGHGGGELLGTTHSPSGLRRNGR